MPGIQNFIENGALLGQLWIEGYFEVGDPLINSGGPKHSRQTTLPPEQG
jgi:hypothetical protein